MKILKSMMICLAMMLVMSVVPTCAEEAVAQSLIGDIVFANAIGDENTIETTTGEVSFSFVPTSDITSRRLFTAVVLKYAVTEADFFASDNIDNIATIAQSKLEGGKVTFNVNLFNEPTGKHTVIVSYAGAMDDEDNKLYKTADFKYVNPNKIDENSKSVVSSINTAIGNADKTAIETVLKTEASVKALSELNSERILNASAAAVETVAAILASGDKFENESGAIAYNEIEEFCAVVNEAFAYAELNKAPKTEDVKSAVEFYNDTYYNLDLTNEIFKNNTETVYEYMTGKNVADKDDANDAFMYAVLRTDLEKTNYSDIYNKVDNYLDTLDGVDTDAFDDVDDTDAFGRHVLGNIEDAKTLEDIEDIINDYEETSGGGGGGGGGGGAVSGGSISLPAGGISIGSTEVADAKKPAEKAALFSDMPTTHWAYGAVEYMLGKGAVKGYEDGTFAPTGGVTRAEFVKMAVNLFGITLAEGAEAPAFDDVAETDWFYGDVAAAAASGLVTGSGSSFNPNAKITRQEIAVILNRYIEKAGKNLAKPNAPVVFADGDSIASWAFESVVTLQQIGIISGFEDGSFAPAAGATRAEAATMLYRLDTAKDAEIQEVAN